MSVVDIFGDVKKTTERAVLVETDDGAEVWIPRSVITKGDAVEEGDETRLEVQEWFAEKEGLV